MKYSPLSKKELLKLYVERYLSRLRIVQLKTRQYRMDNQDEKYCNVYDYDVSIPLFEGEANAYQAVIMSLTDKTMETIIDVIDICIKENLVSLNEAQYGFKAISDVETAMIELGWEKRVYLNQT